jgi:hypothetical protein
MTSQEILIEGYNYYCNNVSDIYEHLPTLNNYAQKCSHITECGVRGIISSYALAYGLLNKTSAKLVQIDPEKDKNSDAFIQLCKLNNIECVFYQESDLICPIENTELLFIDTWHVYGQLKRELARWNSHVSKYIIMHDTTVDEWIGESIRDNLNIEEQSLETGIPIDEITKGLWPAIDEFLIQHPEWILEKRYTNNNGLTILRRV